MLANEAIAAWPSAPATRCWSFGPEGDFIKARIIPQGSGFFAVSSILIENGKFQNVGGGTAYVKGDSIYWTLNFAGNDETAMWTSQSYLIINKRTLSGQLESIGHDINYNDDTLDTEYRSSNPLTLTPIQCAKVRW